MTAVVFGYSNLKDTEKVVKDIFGIKVDGLMMGHSRFN